MPLKFPAELSVLVETISSPFIAFEVLANKEPPSFEFVFFNHPEKYGIAIEEGIEFARKLWKKNGILEILKFFNLRLLVFSQGIPRLRKDRLELFHFLSTSLDFNQIITFELAEEIFSYGYEILDYMGERINEIEIPIDSKLPKLLKEVSDLHIHLGGALRFCWRFRELMENPFRVNTKVLPKDPKIDSLPRYLTFNLVREPVISAVNRLFPLDYNAGLEVITKYLIILTSFLERILIYFLHSDKFPEISPELLWELPSLSEINLCFKSENPIFKSALYHIVNSNLLEGDRFFLLSLFLMLKRKRNFCFRKYLQAYLILRNFFKNLMIQQHRKSDFLYFSWFSRSTLRRDKKFEEYTYIAESFRKSFPPNITLNIEARLSFQESPERYFYTISEISKRFSEFKNMNVKFIFHLRKTDKLEDKIADEIWIRRGQQRRKLFKQVKTFIKFLKTYGDKKVTISSGETSVLSLIHGIDAASKEYFTPPEIFSHIYLLLKRAFFYKKLRWHPNFQFTFHVGEEFKTVLQGISRIYEAVYFLNLTEGDRIGHGIALGISVKDFHKQRRNSCFLKKQEFLDSLAFLYFVFSRLKPINEAKILIFIKDKTEQIIREALSYTKSPFKNLTPDINDYIDSWLLRRNCPVEFAKLIETLEETEQTDSLEEKVEKLTEFVCVEEKRRELLDKFSLLSFSSSYELHTALPDIFIEKLKLPGQNIAEIRRIRGNAAAWKFYYLYNFSRDWFIFMENFHDEIFPEEELIELVEEAQAFIRNHIKKLGISIEVLLTSNLLITPIENIEEHPVFKFIEDGLKVVLGSDNPGIQETSIRFELEILYTKLKERFGEKKACKILKEIVEEGNVLFKA